MRSHFNSTFYCIRVAFWAFPYLLWQTLNHWSGFVIGVLLAVILTMMLHNLFCFFEKSFR
ncbi:hypothetical protein EI42_02402 [Thermosporothrix hazakensis]|jgi:multisubunit Na+/H+ antiporter MnhE subunit|uniref:Uncharacterized protein n=1 Tax=Thermosporothrix hazakensis TaxID=644383 RepID=A0A326UNH7_THEHA|nr:hypothetical protein EI42_02402 [Thermosporothrix hazakensis]